MKSRLVFILLCLSAFVLGQFPDMDPFYFHAADVALLQVKSVQKEIGVTEAQRARMNTFATQHTAKLQALEAEYQKAKKDPAQAQADPRLIGYFLELKKNVMAQLSAAQLKRLGEISLQNLGLAALTDDRVGAKVGLSKDVIAKMRAAYQDGGAKYSSAERIAAQPVLDKYKNRNAKDQAAMTAMQKQFDQELGAAMKKAQPTLTAVKAATEKSMRALLTPKQEATYKGLLGKPFKP